MIESDLDWRVAIYFQLALLVPLTLAHTYFPAENYQMHDTGKDDRDRESEGRGWKGATGNDSMHIEPSQMSMDNSSFTRMNDKLPAVRGRRRSSQWSISDCGEKHLTVMQSINRLLKCEIYLYMSLGLAALYFVVTGVQFWVTTYFTQVLDVPRRSVLAAFTVCSVTAPVLGVIGSGWIMDKLGGYKGTNGMAMATKCCTSFGALAFAFAVPAALLNNFGAVIFCLWMVLLWGGGIVPIASGLVLSAVPEGLQAFSFSLSICTYQVLGYGAGTFLPGLFIQLLEGNGVDEDEALRWGFRVIMFWGGWALLFLFLSMRVAVRNAKLCAAMKANASTQDAEAATSVITRLVAALSVTESENGDAKERGYVAPEPEETQNLLAPEAQKSLDESSGPGGIVHSPSMHGL